MYATLDQVAFQRELLAELDLQDRVTVRAGVARWVDAWSLGGVRGGAVSYLSWEGEYGRYYHTEHDVYRADDYSNLINDLRLGALGVLRVDQSVVLPIRFSDVADWVTGQLRNVEGMLSDVAGPSELLHEAQEGADILRRQANKAEAVYSSIADAADAALLNALLMNTRPRPRSLAAQHRRAPARKPLRGRLRRSSEGSSCCCSRRYGGGGEGTRGSQHDAVG